MINHAGVVGISAWIIDGVGAAKFALPVDYLQADIARAVELGKQRCLAAFFCPGCGAYMTSPVTWFCPNCGRQATPPEEGEKP